MRPPDAPEPEDEPDAGTAGADDDDTDEPEPAPSLPARPVDPWKARVLQPVFTLVDEAGQPVTRGAKADTVVEVRVDGEFRMKVWCGTCEPVGEGWIQSALLERASD